MAEERGEKYGSIAGWIIDDWIEKNADRLANVYGITRDEYRASVGLKPRETQA